MYEPNEVMIRNARCSAALRVITRRPIVQKRDITIIFIKIYKKLHLLT